MPTAPRPEQIEELMKKAPKDGPLHMLNLLKFKEKADYSDGRKTDLTGAEAYGLYGAEVGKIILGMGGTFAFGGRTNVLVIGDGDLQWDAAAIAVYPSLQHFFDMTASEEYQAIHVHRDAGLEHQLLINCLTGDQVEGH